MVLAGCSSPTAPTGSPQASPETRSPAATTLAPAGVAFWDLNQGLFVASPITPRCTAANSPCPDSVIERTTDGGKHWQVVDRVRHRLQAVAVAVAVAGGDVAWVTSGRLDCGIVECGSSSILQTQDGWATWKEVTPNTPVGSVTPVSASTAWAIAASPTGAAPGGTRLVHSTNGGRTWHKEADVCSSFAGFSLSAVNFSGPSQGSALCTSEPATDMQFKALYATSDGGSTWNLRSDCPADTNSGQPTASLGSLSCVGYQPESQILADGHGWLWSERSGLPSTIDGGRTWGAIAQNVVFADTNAVATASLVTAADGFILISPRPESSAGCPAGGCGTQLLSTQDAGQTWRVVKTWAPP